MKNNRDDRVSTSFKLRSDLRTELKIAAARQRREMSELLTEALEQYLAKLDRETHVTK